MVSQEPRNLEKHGNEHGAASTYHQLGTIAEERRDFETAEKWYLKSLEIKEKQGNEHGAASTYHQLGMIAQERRDFETAEKWYLKSLEIEEKHGNEHGAASTYGQLGILAGLQGAFRRVRRMADQVHTWPSRGAATHTLRMRHTRNFVLSLGTAPAADKARMLKLWQEAGLGDLPKR